MKQGIMLLGLIIAVAAASFVMCNWTESYAQDRPSELTEPRWEPFGQEVYSRERSELMTKLRSVGQNSALH